MKNLLILLLLSLPAFGQCTAGTWCNVFSQGNGILAYSNAQYKDNDWDRAYFSHETGFIYLNSQFNQTADGSWGVRAGVTNCTQGSLLAACNPYNSTTLATPFSSDTAFTKAQFTSGNPTFYTIPPMEEFASSGITGGGGTAVGTGLGAGFLASSTTRNLFLTSPVAATDQTITACVYSSISGACISSGGTANFPPSGTIVVDDEAIDYSSCTALDVNGVAVPGTSPCNANAASTYTFTVAQNCEPKPTGISSCRGQRQGAGYTPAVAHSVNLGKGSSPYDFGRVWMASTTVYATTVPNGSTWQVAFGPRVNTQAFQGGVWNTTIGSGQQPTFQWGGITSLTQHDAPMDRHNVGSEVYDCYRGRVWKAKGFQETQSMADTWYIPLAVPPANNVCGIPGLTPPADATTTGQLTSTPGWQHVPLSGNGGSCPVGSFNNICMASGNYSENDYVYVPPPYDVIFEYGGIQNGTSGDSWIFCLGATDNGVPACHSGGTLTGTYVQRAWLPVCNTQACQGTFAAPVHGNAGQRDGVRLSWDPVDKKVLLVGGREGSTANCNPGNTGGESNPAVVCWVTVAQWNPATNDFCLSDTSQNGAIGGFGLASGGAGYQVGDILTVSGGTAQILVNNVLSGVIQSSGTSANIVASPNGVSEVGNTVTVNLASPLALFVGQIINVSGVGVTGYNNTNGQLTVASILSSTQFTYVSANTGLAASGGGKVSIPNGIVMLDHATGYATGNGVALTGGHGTGATLNITGIHQIWSGSACSLPAINTASIPKEYMSLYFPYVAWDGCSNTGTNCTDNNIDRMVLVKPDELNGANMTTYLYKPSTNQWTKITTIAGNVPPSAIAPAQPSKSLVHDDIQGGLWLVTDYNGSNVNFNIFELSDASLGGNIAPPPPTFSLSTTRRSGKTKEQ